YTYQIEARRDPREITQVSDELAGLDEPRKMQQTIRLVLLKQAAHRRTVHDIAAYPPDTGDILWRSLMIQPEHIKSAFDQGSQTMTAEETGGAGHHYIISSGDHALISARSLKNLGQFLSCVETTLIASGQTMLNVGSSWRTPAALSGT